MPKRQVLCSQRSSGEGHSVLWGRRGQRTAARESLPPQLGQGPRQGLGQGQGPGEGLGRGQRGGRLRPGRGLRLGQGGLEQGLGQTQRIPPPCPLPLCPCCADPRAGHNRQPASRLAHPSLQDAGRGGNPVVPQQCCPPHPLRTQIMQLLMKGNRQRTQEPTAANQTSSRSHAVLQVAVRQRSRVKNVLQEVRQGRLFMIDLAGSERASQVRSAPPRPGRMFWGVGERAGVLTSLLPRRSAGSHPGQGGWGGGGRAW